MALESRSRGSLPSALLVLSERSLQYRELGTKGIWLIRKGKLRPTRRGSWVRDVEMAQNSLPLVLLAGELHDPAILLLGINPGGVSALFPPKDRYKHVQAALFLIVKN